MVVLTNEGESTMAEEFVRAEDVVGAIRSAMTQALAPRGRSGPGHFSMPYAKPPLPAEPVQQNTAALRSYMGFGFVSWVTVDGADKVSIVEPQESFRGERLIIDTTASGGTAAGLSLLRRIDIGTQPQSPSVEQPAPAAMFRADATETTLDLQIAYRATKVQITMGQTAAPGAGVTVTAAIGMFGKWVR
jgi:hypothetical protein